MLPEGFPFRNILQQFLDEYKTTDAYWYVPKARSLSDENVGQLAIMLSTVFESYLDQSWNRDTQDHLLKELVANGVFDPYRPEGSLADRTALVRINTVLLETLGLLWVENEGINVTDAGLNLISSGDEYRDVVNKQIAKYQYPTPTTPVYHTPHLGLLPHLFLLQILQRVGYSISFTEFELFLNLARKQDDLDRIISFILCWRDLSEAEQERVLDIVSSTPVFQPQQALPIEEQEDEEQHPTRFRRIAQSASYQRAFFCYPNYLSLSDERILCVAQDEVNELVNGYLENLKILEFAGLADWIAYYGDPAREPSWFTFLVEELENSEEAQIADDLISASADRLTEEEKEELKIRQLERDIETFYAGQLASIETDLTLVQIGDQHGRQYSTPIGRIDLLCKDGANQFVVIEVKAYEARDSAFGQVLRYMGWVSRHLSKGAAVRGIILASKFPETARYSRIGLQRPDYKDFIKFKEHGLALSDT